MGTVACWPLLQVVIIIVAMSGKVVVYGGCGGLGLVVVNHYKAAGYWVLSVDIRPNDAADANALVSLADGWVEQEQGVCHQVEAALLGSKVDAVINVAGGWAGGNAANADWVKNADLMWKQSVWRSAISATIAAKHLKEGGLIVLPGAKSWYTRIWAAWRCLCSRNTSIHSGHSYEQEV